MSPSNSKIMSDLNFHIALCAQRVQRAATPEKRDIELKNLLEYVRKVIERQRKSIEFWQQENTRLRHGID